MTSESPHRKNRSTRNWNCDNFTAVNDIIEEQNGKEFKIDW